MHQPMRMSLPDVALYDLARELAKELGLVVTLDHGPKDDAIEGHRLIIISGLPERLVRMENLFAVKLQRMLHDQQKQVQSLYHLWNISP